MASDGPNRENADGDGNADLQNQEDQQEAQRSVFRRLKQHVQISAFTAVTTTTVLPTGQTYVEQRDLPHAVVSVRLCGSYVPPMFIIAEQLGRAVDRDQEAEIGHAHQAQQGADHVGHHCGPDLDPGEKLPAEEREHVWTSLKKLTLTSDRDSG